MPSDRAKFSEQVQRLSSAGRLNLNAVLLWMSIGFAVHNQASFIVRLVLLRLDLFGDGIHFRAYDDAVGC